MEKVVILGARRTPIGKYRGKLAATTAAELGVCAAKGAIQEANISPNEIQQVIIGNVLSAGNGQNIARQIAIRTGIPYAAPATTINEVCGSSMKAVLYAAQQIRLNEAEVVIAGGTENMSQAPKIAKYDYQNEAWAEAESSLIVDGLTDVFSQVHMGHTAEKIAAEFAVSRSAQDEFSLQSQHKAAAAQENDKFAREIVPVTTSEGTLVLAEDEGVRKDTSLEKLAQLTPVFLPDGKVTAGNCSTLNDGASMLVLASKSYADAHQLPYLAILEDYAEIGIDPQRMGISPIRAIEALAVKAKLDLKDVDLFEINEAFASTSLVVEKTLALAPEKINIYGGAIAIGHPIGATGARLLTTLISELHQEKKELGIASLCVGGGMGLAMLLRRGKARPEKPLYRLTLDERRKNVSDTLQFSTDERRMLQQSGLEEEIFDHLTENALTTFEVPFGVAQNYLINQTEKLIPYATEEPSVIAASSHGAKLIRTGGGFVTTTLSHQMQGQIVFHQVADPEALKTALTQIFPQLSAAGEEIHPSLYARGGGIRDFQIRSFPDEGFVSLDVFVDTLDAMGANLINSLLEGLAAKLRVLFPDQEILFSILSNFPLRACSRAEAKIPFKALARPGFSGKHVAQKIVAAAKFAKIDPFRAATHNKGIMNGIDAVVLATGNDVRAVEASCSAYANRNGRCEGLSDWKMDGEYLYGCLTLPLPIGIVGGATRVLPKAQLALKILKVKKSTDLAEILTAVGLAQNLAALKALVSEGIQKGHMALQARSLAISAGAGGNDIPRVAQALQKLPRMDLAAAKTILAQLARK